MASSDTKLLTEGKPFVQQQAFKLATLMHVSLQIMLSDGF